MDSQVIYAILASFITVLVVTPLVIKLAFKIGATDKPNARKVHQKIMPRLGGLAIFIGVAVGFVVGGLYEQRMLSITLGAIIIVIIGILDDMYELSASKIRWTTVSCHYDCKKWIISASIIYPIPWGY